MKCIDIDKDNCEQLLDYDIIEFIGGDPFYLLNSMNKCGCKDVLKKINRLRDGEALFISESNAEFIASK